MIKEQVAYNKNVICEACGYVGNITVTEPLS